MVILSPTTNKVLFVNRFLLITFVWLILLVYYLIELITNNLTHKNKWHNELNIFSVNKLEPQKLMEILFVYFSHLFALICFVLRVYIVRRCESFL